MCTVNVEIVVSHSFYEQLAELSIFFKKRKT